MSIFRAAAVLIAAVLFGCRPASTVPPPEGPGIPGIPGPGDEKTVSIALLRTLYNGAPVLLTDEILISGAVVSSDREGNFYKTLVLDDGTAGIEVRLDVEEIFKRFMIHTRVGVRCNGLWLGSYGGTLQLGAAPFDDSQTRPLPAAAVAEHLFPDETFYGEVLPATLSFGEISQRRISTYVAFEGVRFSGEEQGLTWAEPETDTNRHLVDGAGDTLIVRTSHHANFAVRQLPEGTGRIEGVLGYFNGDYQLVVCDSQQFYGYEYVDGNGGNDRNGEVVHQRQITAPGM